MKTLLDYIRVLLLCVGGMLVSCTVLIVMSEQANGMIAGKQSWIYFSLIWFALSVLFVVLTKKGSVPFSFSLTDGIVIALLAVLLISYPWEVNPAPDKLNIAILLTAFWFLLRIVLITYPYLFSFFLFIYVFTGGVEALWGFAQVYQWTDTDYMTESMVGSFYSSEAYSGYLALLLPLCLSVSCYYRSCKKLQWWRMTTLLYYTASVSSVLIVIALVLSANRIAWMAAIISSVWVVWMRLSIHQKIKERWKLSHRSFTAITVIGVVLLLVVAGSVGLMNNRKVNEKIPLWRVTTAIATDNPVLGTGLGGFPNAVLRLQNQSMNETSFYRTALPAHSVTEPLYVHNEYLQILMEQGIVGLLFFLALLVSSFYLGLKNKQWGACGALLSLAVFSLASYPLQVPSFLITFTFLLVICQVRYQQIIPPLEYYTYQAEPSPKGSDKEARKALLKNLAVVGFTVILLATTYGLLWVERKSYEKESNFSGSVYQTQEGEILYPRFGHYPEFYCEYAQDLNHSKCYHASAQLLTKATRYCHHPAIYDIQAQNLQASGNHEEAEALLLATVRKHPGRLNSYYLLAKLYSMPEYYHPQKMKEMAKIVLNNNRVVYSRLNKHMEKEMWNLLNTDKKADNCP